MTAAATPFVSYCLHGEAELNFIFKITKCYPDPFDALPCCKSASTINQPFRAKWCARQRAFFMSTSNALA